MHLIQSLNDLFRGEISFIQLIQETTPDCNPTNSSSLQVNDGNTVTHIQNGDLAEADQSRGGETENEEEEGAVGGFLDVPHEITVKTDHKVDLKYLFISLFISSNKLFNYQIKILLYFSGIFPNVK